MDFKALSLCCWKLLLLLQTAQVPFASAQLDLPLMPGPPYPDPRGQNRWGVKFDPRLHGPPFDKTQEAGKPAPRQNFNQILNRPQVQQNNYQRPLSSPGIQNIQNSYQRPPIPISPIQSQSQEIAFQRPPPPPSYAGGNGNIYSNVQGSPPAGFTQNPNAPYSLNTFNANQYKQGNVNNQFRNQQFSTLWANTNNKGASNPWNNIKTNNNINNIYNYNKAVRPPSALNSNINGQKTKEQKEREENYWNRIMGFFSSNNGNKITEAQVQPSNFRYHATYGWRNVQGKGRPPLRKKPKKKQQSSWPIFTTIGKGMDTVGGGLNTVRKVVQGTTGRALATGVKIGGKVAYLGAQTAAKVITKVSSW